MTDETIIKIETPEPEVITESHAIVDPPTIVEPVIDMAVKLGEVCSKMELVESALAATLNENAELKSQIVEVREELWRVRTLMETPTEPEIIEDTPESELPVESLPEIEIIPEQLPEVVEEVKKRKRFFV